MVDTKTIVYKGSRGDDFRDMLTSVFRLGNLSQKYFDVLTNEKSMREYDKVFTSSGADVKNNYQMYEILGDSTSNKCIVWYFYRRFPQLHCPEGVKVIARLKINYVSKKEFASIGEGMGFWNFITAISEERASKKRALLEDVFEAFIGATEYLLDLHFQVGVGYSVVYDIFENVFDKKEISLRYEDLYDAKTRVKEYFDMHRDMGQLVYNNIRDPLTGMFVSSLFSDRERQKILGTGQATNKGDAEQIASQDAIDHYNLVRELPEFYKYFC